jgi:hypothetical protein
MTELLVNEPQTDGDPDTNWKKTEGNRVTENKEREKQRQAIGRGTQPSSWCYPVSKAVL